MFKSRKHKIWTAWVLTLAMFMSMLQPGFTPIVKAAGVDKVFDLVEITDFHGALLSSDATPLPAGAVLAQNIKDLKKANPNRTLIIGGGDLYQGTPVSNVLRGVPVQKMMDNIGMEVTALGNHEFDWSLDTLINTTMKDAQYSIVCANLVDKTTGNKVFAPYKIITKDNVRIAVIGAITSETPTIVMPAYVANYNFTDPATEINAYAKEIKDGNKADVVIAVIHAGNSGSTGEIFDITNKLTNVNAVFGGHSHTTLTSKGTNNIPIYIANSTGKGYIDAKMTVAADGTVTFPTPVSADYKAIDTTAANGYKNSNPKQDPEVKSIVDNAVVEVGPTFNEVIGTTAIDLNKTQVPSPYGESLLGNWCADTIRIKASADVGIQNNGGIRINIPAGNITVGQIFNLMPFDNEINVVTVNKSQLIKIMNRAVQDSGKGMQISGIKVTYDPTAPTLKRVIDVTREDGKKVSDTEKLTLAGPDFVLTGGDTFVEFTDPAIASTLKTDHVLVRDALLENVRQNKGIVTSMPGRYVLGTIPRISVVATSDVHGNILNWDYSTGKVAATGTGLAKVSSYVKSLKTTNPNVMLIDNGDTIQGTPLVYYYNMIDTKTVYPMMAAMGAMGYDAWTLGNHEYNYGLTTLNRIINDAKSNNISVLSANTYKSDNTNFVQPYTIKTFNVNGKSVKVGILGLTTKTIPSWEDSAHYSGLHFNDLVDEAKKWVPEVKKAGADVVIVSAHSGEEGAADVIPENQVKALATGVTGIDAIIAGHAHSTLNDLSLKNPEGKVVPVLEPGKWAQKVSQIDIFLDDAGKVSGLTTNNVVMNDTYPEDPAIVALAKPYQDTTLGYLGTKIGTSTGEFKGDGQTTQPTAIMELINKVQKEAAGTQLSIAAPLSSTAYLPKGDITIQNLMTVYVFENFLYGVKMSGKQLKDWMEFSVRYYKQVQNPTDPIVADYTVDANGKKTQIIPDFNLDQLYGATYDVDLTQSACTTDPKTGRVISGNRIKNLKINGKLVDDNDMFTVAINNYRYNGGGGFMAAAGLSSTDPSIVTYDSAKAKGDDGQVRSLMMEYIQNHKTIDTTNENNWKISTSAVQETTPDEVNLQVLATSDTHGRFLPYDYAINAADMSGSLAQIATAVKELRKANPNTVLLDVGDTIQDNSADLFLKDPIHPMVLAMNEIGYDTWTTGNHEYNYGIPTLEKIMAQSKATVLAGNVYRPDGTRLGAPYKILNIDGVKVAIIGMVTPNITKWDAENLKGYTVTDPVEETKKVIAELKGKVDVMIAAEHMAEANEYGVKDSGAIDLANACPELTVILAAHEHKAVTGAKYNNVLLVENKNGAATLGQINIKLVKGNDGKYQVQGMTSGLKYMTSKDAAGNTVVNYKPDADLVAKLASFDKKAKDDANIVIGKLVGGDLVPADEVKGIPTSQIQETAMINLINKVQMYYTGAEVSAAAAFDIRANMKAGDIKKADTSLIYKYANTLYKLQMTGAQLKKFMEWSACYYNTFKPGDLTVSFNENIRGYNYDMFTGVKYDVDISKEPWHRIVNLTRMDGTPVKDTDTFVVAVNNYRASSQLLSYGEIFKQGEALPVLLEKDVRGDIGGVRELIRDYITNVKNGVIKPEVDNNWKVIGNNWDPAMRAKAVELINAGTIKVPMAVDNRTPNVKSVTIDDIKPYLAVEPGNNGGNTTEPTKPVQVVNDTAKVVDAVKNAPAKSTVVVDVTNNSVASKDIFTAIQGKDINVTFQKDGITWTFNGKDIDPSLIKDIDLSLKTVSADLKAKEAAKVKAIVGKDVAIVPFSFTYDGKLPGKATVKVFIGKDWANRTVYVNRYYADKNTYETVAEATVDADGYMSFTTDHCSDYFVMDKSAAPNLPKTGSAMDMNVVVGLGSLAVLLGAALFISGRKRRENDIAA